MIIETRYMTIDIDEIAGIFRNDSNLLQVFFKNGLRESISYNEPKDMSDDYNKLIEGWRQRKN